MIWFLAACRPATEESHPSATLDLTEPLGAGEVRAGRITDEDSLFGGIAAEGRIGDFLLYNDRVRFVVQDARASNYYLSEGGGVVDADVVRPAGMLGRDHVDEWTTSIGGVRVVTPESVTLGADGTDGVAEVTVLGTDVPLGLAEGALEGWGFVPQLGLEVETTYRLVPDSWLLEVTTTVTAPEEVTVQLGDMLMGGPEDAQVWSPRTGFETSDGDPVRLAGYIGKRNDFALALVADSGAELTTGALNVIGNLANMVLGFDEARTLAAGDSATFTRHYGVGPDLATLSDSKLELDQTEVTAASGTVTAPDGGVAGARVHVLVDGLPYTVAVTGSDGSFSTSVPSGSTVTTVADGRGRGLFLDLPPGAVPMGPYAADTPQAQALAALGSGATAVAEALGRGLGTGDGLTLAEPARLRVASDDGLPFEVRLTSLDPADTEDSRLFKQPPGGFAASGWARDGSVEILVAPGNYRFLAHRGIVHDIVEQDLALAAGANDDLTVALPAAYDHPGSLIGDPHTHAAPSGDGEIPMEDRLVVSASVGVQLHFGTDHDHIADYRPLVTALGLDDVLQSVVSDEVSPVMRGHLNLFPLDSVPETANRGAWAWWSDPVESTSDEFERLRARHADVLISANHPMSSGLAEAAEWSEGNIGRSDFWTEDFDATEVNNAGHTEASAFYLDITARGLLPAALGVSDSHGHFGGDPGLNLTFIGTGTDLAGYTSDALRDAIRAGRTVASRGIYLETSIDPGSTVEPSALSVTAHSAPWISVDRVKLYRDGAEAEVVEGTEATFSLEPDADAVYVVIAEGDAPMEPVYPGDLPWAMTSAIRVDVGGDGWTAPKPALTLAD